MRIDVAAARDAALPEERVIASHADENDTEYLMAETDCYLSSAIGHSWPVGVDPEDVRTVVWESQRWVLGFDG